MLRFYLDSDKVDRTRQSEVPCCQKKTLIQTAFWRFCPLVSIYPKLSHKGLKQLNIYYKNKTVEYRETYYKIPSLFWRKYAVKCTRSPIYYVPEYHSSFSTNCKPLRYLNKAEEKYKNMNENKQA